MIYSVSRVLSQSPAQLWAVLRDLRHYVHADPFHSDLRFLTAQHEGRGTAFRMRHAYVPNFPFGPDEVTATVTAWESERLQTILEENPKAYRTHTQTFRLEATDAGTRVTYDVHYMGIPLWLLPWRMWVRWSVRRRQEEKLRDIETQAQELSRQRK